MNFFKSISLLLLLSGCFMNIKAQDVTDMPIRKIGVFAPLYLDSAFHGNDYQFGKKFPRFTLQGFDFVQGVQIASDSFPLSDCKWETSIFDTRSDSLPLTSLIASHQLDDLQLMLASVKDEAFLQLAGFAKEKNIPLISVTYPNDGNITNNPYLIILNPTLKTHCESIFSYLLQNHNTDNIIHVRQTGSQEDRVAGYFNAINKADNKALLDIKTMNLDSNFYLIKTKLDSTRKNIIIGGSLDEDFANSITVALNNYKKKYDIMLIGMPNWESFGTLGKNLRESAKNFPIYFTSSYYNSRNDTFSNTIQNNYTKQFKGKPSDYTFKSFEAFYVFSRLLNLYPESLINNITDQTFSLFSNYNLVPVHSKKGSKQTDYYENKHLFFLKKMNGQTVNGW